MNKILFLIAILIAGSCNVTAQLKYIKGNVLVSNQTAEGIYIQIINPLSNNVIAFDATQANGNYEIACNSKSINVLLKISHVGYIPIDTLINLEKEITNLNFNLQKNNQTLAPVNIIVTRPIEINGDTTSYNVASLKKDEKSIEALLKKLPGFEVDDKGNIKFKNKPIKTILLDGDDVVNDDYQVLSKNITPDMVDKIQAIENYNSNELLTGITKGDETVLNLKVNKKFKGVIFLKTNALTTIKDSLHQIENTSLAIFKNLKIVNVFNRNNIGKYNNSNTISENNQDKLGTSNALINNNYLSHLNEESNGKFNNTWANSFNLLYKQKGQFEINTRYTYFSDIQRVIQHNEIDYLSSNPTIKLEENIQKQVKAKTHKGYLSAKFYTSRLSYFTLKLYGQFIRSALVNENKNTFNTLTNKNTDTINSNNINLYFIKKLNLKNALEIEINRNYKDNTQLLLIVPGLYSSFFNNSTYDAILQPANFKEQNWSYEFRITGYNNWIKYKFKSGYLNHTTKYNSRIELLKPNSVETADSLTNTSIINNQNIYFAGAVEKAFFKQNLNLKVENNFNYSRMNAGNFTTLSQLFYNPEIQVTYRIGTFGNLLFTFTKKQSFGERKNYLSNYFFQEYKVLEKNNIAEALIEKKKIYALNYAYVNLFKNQRVIFIGTSYTRNSVFFNRFLQNYNDYNIQRNQKLQTPINNISLMNYAILSKRIKPLHNTLKFSLFYIFNKTRSIQSNSSITDFISNILSSNIGLNSNYKGPVNYQLKIGLSYYKNRAVFDYIKTDFDNIAYTGSADLHIAINKNIKSNIDFNYTKNKVSTYSLNADIEYDFSKKGLAISVGGNNLLNNNKIVNYYTTDFFIQRNESKLFPRFFYLKISYNFSFKM